MSINTAELTQHTTETKITQGKLAVVGTLSPEHQAIFPVEAQTFLQQLCERFAPRVDELLTLSTKASYLIFFLKPKISVKEAGRFSAFQTICKIVA